ncbi:MAG: adenylate kinase family protein [Microcystaceae cyanobacterium]
MRLVMLGGPGAGKGTQSLRLAKSLAIPTISIGGILREAISANTSLGQKAEPYVEKGELLPDEIMIQFMRQRLLRTDIQKGWVLDGYPRTAFQAEELDFLLDELNQKIDWAIYLKVSEAVMQDRSLSRSLLDDSPDVIERRIEAFKRQTIPILEYYEGTKRLLTIAADSSAEEVEQATLNHLQHN